MMVRSLSLLTVDKDELNDVTFIKNEEIELEDDLSKSSHLILTY
jgi:hypothetical protein